jgi:hypothetical protein
MTGVEYKLVRMRSASKTIVDIDTRLKEKHDQYRAEAIPEERIAA